MVKKNLEADLKSVLEDLGFPAAEIVFRASRKSGCDPLLSIPQNSQFGDYTTNVALQLAKQNSQDGKQSAQEIANKIVTSLQSLGSSKEYLEKAEVAGPGFINFYLKDEFLVKNLSQKNEKKEKKEGKKFLVEYGHANFLKEVHIGHLRTFILGESLSRILDFTGNQVFRANYQGDIGLHIAKALWGIKKDGLPEGSFTSEEKAKLLGKAYAAGSKAYAEDKVAKEEIDQINIALYQGKSDLGETYDLTREWNLEYFAKVYEMLDINYDRCFFESEVAERGLELVKENIGKIFKESQGAIIFPGENIGLHNRVFITSVGNPTYEAKDIGLAELEYGSFNYDKSIHIVAAEQEDYFKVVFKAIEAVFPHLKDKKYHLSYGFVDLKGGKMSSRTGNVVTIHDLERIVSERAKEVMRSSGVEIDEELSKQVTMGAIKFYYLKYSPRPNMVFDPQESVSLHGDSGPYIQYAYARIQSILKKYKDEVNVPTEDQRFTVEERGLLRRVEYFDFIVEEAATLYRPNLICEYLLELAGELNLFYQKNRVLKSEREQFRIALIKKVGEILKTGLFLLGIEAPERM